MPTNDEQTKHLDEHSLRYITKSGIRYVTRERHTRLKHVEQLLVAGLSETQIAADVSTTYGVTPATIHQDIELLYDNWTARDGRMRPLMRQQVTQMLHTVYRMALADSKYSAANQAAMGIARIHGLTGPDQHAHLHVHQSEETLTLDDLESDLATLGERLSYKRARLKRAEERVIDVESAS